MLSGANSWFDANAKCTALNAKATLVSIDSSFENAQVNSKAYYIPCFTAFQALQNKPTINAGKSGLDSIRAILIGVG